MNRKCHSFIDNEIRCFCIQTFIVFLWKWHTREFTLAFVHVIVVTIALINELAGFDLTFNS